MPKLIVGLGRVIKSGHAVAADLLIPAVLGNVLWVAGGAMYGPSSIDCRVTTLLVAVSIYLLLDFGATRIERDRIKTVVADLNSLGALDLVPKATADARVTLLRRVSVITTVGRIIETPALGLAVLAAGGSASDHWDGVMLWLAVFTSSLTIAHSLKLWMFWRANSSAAKLESRRDWARSGLLVMCAAHTVVQLRLLFHAPRVGWEPDTRATASVTFFAITYGLYLLLGWGHRVLADRWDALLDAPTEEAGAEAQGATSPP